MQSYLIYNHAKVFVKPQQKPLDVIKTTNIDIFHYRQKAILPSDILIDASLTADLQNSLKSLPLLEYCKETYI